MSWVNLVLTANSRKCLPEPFQSRCVVLDLPDLTTEQVRQFAITEGNRGGLPDSALAALIDIFDCGAISNARLSLWTVSRMLDRAESHLMDRTLTKIPELGPADDGVPRVIACPVPSPATFKSITLALLEESGYRGANPRQETWSLWQVFRYRLGMLGVAVFWINEAQDLFLRRSQTYPAGP